MCCTGYLRSEARVPKEENSRQGLYCLRYGVSFAWFGPCLLGLVGGLSGLRGHGLTMTVVAVGASHSWCWTAASCTAVNEGDSNTRQQIARR